METILNETAIYGYLTILVCIVITLIVGLFVVVIIMRRRAASAKVNESKPLLRQGLEPLYGKYSPEDEYEYHMQNDPSFRMSVISLEEAKRRALFRSEIQSNPNELTLDDLMEYPSNGELQPICVERTIDDLTDYTTITGVKS